MNASSLALCYCMNKSQRALALTTSGSGLMVTRRAVGRQNTNAVTRFQRLWYIFGSHWYLTHFIVGAEKAMQNFDVVIVGAGISGIGAACHLQSECPEKPSRSSNLVGRAGVLGIYFNIRGFARTATCIPLGLTSNPGPRPSPSPTDPR